MDGRPSFIGLGAQRAGTSWLYAVLRAAPDTWVPPIKELHYWDWADPVRPWPSLRWRRHLGLRLRSNLAAVPGAARVARHPARPETGFDRRYFTGRRSPTWYRRLFDAAPAGAITGEITPSYWRMSTAGIDQLRTACPEVRLVLCLRDPVARTWSMAVKQVARDRGRAIDAVPDAEWLAWIERYRATDYAPAYERWRRAFGDQLLVAWFDELASDPERFLKSVLHHLGSRVDPGDLVARFAGPVNPAAAGVAPPVAVGDALHRRTRADLERLAAHLPDPRWVEAWLERPEADAR